MALEFLQNVIAYRLEISFPTTYGCKLYSSLPSQFARKVGRKIGVSVSVCTMGSQEDFIKCQLIPALNLFGNHSRNDDNIFYR